MEDRLKKLQKSMEKSTFRELSFSEKMRKEIHRQINLPDESDDIVTLAILQLLFHEKTGYELSGLLRSRGVKKYEENEGSLYTMLHTIEQRCLIASCWDEAGAKYYQITDKGRKYARRLERNTYSGRVIIKGLLEE